MPKVFANGRSIVHRGDGLQHAAAPPDVCKTPSPAGPVPVPYVNVASDSALASGAKTTQIEGNPVALASSNLSTSTGDEPGTAGGGVISSKIKGQLKWATASVDVKVEGKGVVRFMDVTQHNGNSFNSAFATNGRTSLAYADDGPHKCEICKKGPKQHRIHETEDSLALCRQLVDALKQAIADPTISNSQKKKLGKNNKGYMVGVMICGTCGGTFTATSGETPPQFRSVASSVSPDLVVIGGERGEGCATAQNFATAQGREDIPAAISERFAYLETQANADATNGYNVPGSCAGAKLVALTPGHKPSAMTEMFFDPKAVLFPSAPDRHWRGAFAVLDADYEYLHSGKPKLLEPYYKVKSHVLSRLGKAKKYPHQFTDGQSVASCQTCQELLYLAMCERTCSASSAPDSGRG